MEYSQGNKINKVPNTQKEATQFSISSAERWEMTVLFVINKWFGTANLGWWVV